MEHLPNMLLGGAIGLAVAAAIITARGKRREWYQPPPLPDPPPNTADLIRETGDAIAKAIAAMNPPMPERTDHLPPDPEQEPVVTDPTLDWMPDQGDSGYFTPGGNATAASPFIDQTGPDMAGEQAYRE